VRLPLLSTPKLTLDQGALYDDIRRGIEANFKGFTAVSVKLNGFDVPVLGQEEPH
jgi:hypothetical protein